MSDRSATSPPDPADAGRRPRRRRVGLWSLLSVAVMAGAAALLAVSLLGTPLTVPDWLRTRITERINAVSGGVEVQLGDVVVVIEQGWKPRLSLRNVVLRTHDGAPLATLSELGGSVALRPLMQGRLQPGTIRVSGAQLYLRREPDGRVGVSLGAAGGPVVRNGAGAGAADETLADDLVSLLGRIDTALQRPALSALRRVRADNLTLRYEDGRAGRAWNVDDGQIELTREGRDLRLRGDFALLGARAYVTTLEMTFASRIGDNAAEFAMRFEDAPAGELALQSPALAWLGALEAPISGGVRVAIDEGGRLGPLGATLDIGAGVLQPNEATKPIAFSSARSDFTYTPASQMIRFENLSLDSEWVSAQAEGAAHLVGMEDGWPDELQAQMRVARIIADPADLYPEPIRIDGASMDMRLVFDPFRLSLGQLSLSDQGRQLVLSGELRGEETGWDLALDGRMDGVDHARLMQLWPVAVIDKTREWVAENVTAGALSNIQFALRSTPKHRPDVYLGFDFDGLDTRFVKEMPPMNDASGAASLQDGRFAIRADRGWVQPAQGGRVDIAGTSFVVPDVDIRRGPAIVNLETESTITAALALLDSEPLKALEKLDRPVNMADGRARVSGRLNFLLKPHLQAEELSYDVAASLADVRSTALVPDRVLAAPSLSLRATNEAIRISGQGRLGQVPVSGVWTAQTGAEASGSRLKGTIEISERFADEFSLGLPPGSLSGAGEASITVDLAPDGTGDFVLRSDLSGVGLRLPQLDWSLAPGSTGNLEVQGRLGQPARIDRLTLDAPGLRSTGSIALRADGTLERALFSRVEVGGWLDAPVELRGRGAGLTPAVVVRGGTVDLRRTSLTQGRDPRAKQGGPVSLELDRLQISDGIALTAFRADLDTANGTDGRFSGRVNGGAPITGQIVPQGGRSAFRIRSDDAGGVMRSAGLLNQARGGTLDLTLVPSAAPGSYEGQLGAENVRLKDAPALAALLSSLSVVGLLEQMGGGGIPFGRVEARFQLSPERVTLMSGSAVGASMGISMDGYYFMESGRMDMQGVVSPFYLVNGIGGVFTRRGEGLVGFNYTIKGTAKAPRVMVNPLSLLTPGMFRELFRRPPPSGVTRQRTDDGTAPPAAARPEPPRKPAGTGRRP